MVGDYASSRPTTFLPWVLVIADHPSKFEKHTRRTRREEKS
jgi:hypothetical protein